MLCSTCVPDRLGRHLHGGRKHESTCKGAENSETKGADGHQETITVMPSEAGYGAFGLPSLLAKMNPTLATGAYVICCSNENGGFLVAAIPEG
jgi:hypothetical protein